MSVCASCSYCPATSDHPEGDPGGSDNGRPPLLQLLLQRVEIDRLEGTLGRRPLFMTGEITPNRLTAETAAIDDLGGR